MQKSFFPALIIFNLSLATAQGAIKCRKIVSTGQSSWSEAIKKDYPVLTQSQPVKVKMQKGHMYVHNTEILPFLTQGQLNQPAKIKELIQLLSKNGTFEFPITEGGFLPAANNGEHHGGYGSFTWLRDLARVNVGVSALPRLLKGASRENSTVAQNLKRMDKALLRLFSETEQMQRTIQNILDPNFHNDAHFGYRNVIFVRLGLGPREHGTRLTKSDIEKEASWGHKQNDALAMYAHAILDGIASGRISQQQMSLDAKAELIYLAAYFQRVKYFRMEDVGAWEERMGVRTSSVGLVTSFLERFNQNWRLENPDVSQHEASFFKHLRGDWNKGIYKKHLESFISQNSEVFKEPADGAWGILKNSIEELPQSIAMGYETLFKGLGIKRTTDGQTRYGKVNEVLEGNDKRGVDAALLHLLLYPLKELKLQDRLHVIHEIEKELLKESGINRYKEDWFLYGGPSAIESAGKLPLDPDMIAKFERGNFVSTNREDRDRIYAEYKRQSYSKYMKEIVRESGEGLEAQWSFQDAMMTQIYVRLYRETFDKKYLTQAKLHLARALAAVTGHNQINIEGASVVAFRVPEAWIPVKLIYQGKEVTAYFTSPNSPLNWSTAELVTALNDYVNVLEGK
jgi:hypothetical protein